MANQDATSAWAAVAASGASAAETPLAVNRSTRLAAEVWVWRFGWLWVFNAVLLIAVAALAWLSHRAQSESASLEQQMARLAQTQADAASKPSTQGASAFNASDEAARLAKLRQTVYAQTQVPKLVTEIQALAKRRGLVIRGLEFRLTPQGFGGLHQHQVTFPVEGSYPAIRGFVTELLVKFPGISVDQLSFRRETAGETAPKSNIKLSIWLSVDKPLPLQAAGGAAR
jgi:hypothetical protein